ncbi:interferon-induced protein with tetratricopeptide repeats 5-like [Hyperolius riggenbachi]|uniref:interferon-induced protein with tetratricopeptide repeats 5-like n=1 Tax=Hyperolius riggenbachi TaxID=752182 RepID=UPI0035A2B658
MVGSTVNRLMLKIGRNTVNNIYITEESLKTRLLNLQCHFTWDLHVEDLGIDYKDTRLDDQMEYVINAPKHRMYNLRAYLRYLRGDYDEAMDQLQKAEEQIQDSDPDADIKRIVMYGNYAWLLYHQKDFIKSSTYAKKVEAIKQNYELAPENHKLLIDIYSEQGWAYLLFGKNYYEKAAKSFLNGLEFDKRHPELNSGYGTARYRIASLNYPQTEFSETNDALENAVKYNPEDAGVKTLLALQYQNQKQYLAQAAVERIEEALEQGQESPYILRYAATFYRKENKTEEAIKLLEKAITLTPTYASIYHQLGMCYKGLATTEAIGRAIFYLKRAVELKHMFPAAYVTLGEMYVWKKKYPEAEEAFHTAEGMTEEITDAVKQELHLIWGQYEWGHRRSEQEAINHFKIAILIKKATKNRKRAIKHLKSIAKDLIGRDSADATGYGLRGFIYQQEGQEKMAIEDYKKALQLQPNNEEYAKAISSVEGTLRE